MPIQRTIRDVPEELRDERAAGGGSVQPMMIAVALTATLASTADPASAADPIADCTRTVYDYATTWDRADGEAFGALFTEDATLDLAGQRTVGRRAITALVKGPNEQTLFRHVMTNVSIDVVDEKTAEGVSYLLLFMAPRPAEENGPVDNETVQSMGEYHDTFAISEDGCKIAKRRLVLVFVEPPPVQPTVVP